SASVSTGRWASAVSTATASTWVATLGTSGRDRLGAGRSDVLHPLDRAQVRTTGEAVRDHPTSIADELAEPGKRELVGGGPRDAEAGPDDGRQSTERHGAHQRGGDGSDRCRHPGRG